MFDAGWRTAPLLQSWAGRSFFIWRIVTRVKTVAHSQVKARPGPTLTTLELHLSRATPSFSSCSDLQTPAGTWDLGQPTLSDSSVIAQSSVRTDPPSWTQHVCWSPHHNSAAAAARPGQGPGWRPGSGGRHWGAQSYLQVWSSHWRQKVQSTVYTLQSDYHQSVIIITPTVIGQGRIYHST